MSQDQLKTAFEQAMARAAAFEESQKHAAAEQARRGHEQYMLAEEGRNEVARALLANALREAQPVPRNQGVRTTTLAALISPFAQELSKFEDYRRRMEKILKEQYPTLVLLDITQPNGCALTKQEEYQAYEMDGSRFGVSYATLRRTVWAIKENDVPQWKITFRVVNKK